MGPDCLRTLATMPLDQTSSGAPVAVDPALIARAGAPRYLDMPAAELGLTWRALSEADLDAYAALVTAIEAADAAPFRTSKEELSELFTGPWRDPLNNSLGGFDTSGVLRAYGTVEVQPGDTTVVRAFCVGGVHPDHRGRGVGTAVLYWQTGRARQLLAASGKAVPWWIVVYVDDRLTADAELVRRAGFTPARWYTEMRRDLSVPLPEVGTRSNLVVVPWSEELDDEVRRAHNAAFADHWGSQPQTPQTWVEGRTCFAPQWSFIMLDKTSDRAQVAGYLISGRYEQDWPALGYPEGYTELLGVLRQWRGQYVASELLIAAMRAYAADGMAYAALGVDTDNLTGALGLYERLGYVATHGTTMYTIEL